MKDYQLIAWDGPVLDDGGTTAVPNPRHIELAQIAGGSAGVGLGSVLGRVYAQVTVAYNNLTTFRLTVHLANADNDSDDTLRSMSGALIMDSEPVARAALVPGRVLLNEPISANPLILMATHLRFRFEVNGTDPTTGSLFAGYSLESEGIRAQRPGQQLRGAYGPWQSQYTAGFNPGTPPRSG